MGKNRELLKRTTSSRTYKLLKRRILTTEKEGLCFICGPRMGCNQYSYRADRSWKEHRKTQYRNK
jgi:hypothetical protein